DRTGHQAGRSHGQDRRLARFMSLTTRPAAMATAVAFGGLLVLAAVLYAAMLTSISELGRGDLAGQGLAAGYASIAGVCLWLTLAALLLLAFLNGVMPRWAAVTMALALPLSGLALIIAAALSPGMSGWALLT